MKLLVRICMVLVSVASGVCGAAEKMVVISGNAKVPGVELSGFPDRVVTDSRGSYRAEVPESWAGRIMPVKEGYRFNPPRRTYGPVSEDLTGQDYAASTLLYEISGSVGLPGVSLQGLPGTTSDATGRYRIEVPEKWSGRVVPVKEGYTFNPPQRRYQQVTRAQRDQDYMPSPVVALPMMPDDAGAFDVLMIPARKIEPQAQAETQEDMLVMLQILRDMLSEPRMILGILYDYGDIFAGGAQKTCAYYLEGYGALFVLEVDFPFLSAEPNVPESEPEQEVDPVWLRARQRLRAPGRGSAYSQRPSDEVSFEQLKTDLIETLKHTANIRHIDPNEQIIFTIVSRAGAGGLSGASAGYFSASGGGWGAGNSYSYNIGGFTAGGSGGESRVPQLDPYGQPKRDALGNTLYQPAPTPPVLFAQRWRRRQRPL